MPVPEGLARWLSRLLRKAPDQRYRDAAHAAFRLTASIDAHPQLIDTVAPVRPAARAATTFLLSDLLDVDVAALANEADTATAEGSVMFDRRRHWRPRLPTPRMFHRGDPPILGYDSVKERLWMLLLAASAGRTQRVELVGEPGSGRRALVQWLKMKATLAGLEHVEVVDVGDGSSEPPAASPEPARLLIWTRPPRASRVEERWTLSRLEPLTVFQVLRSRLMLSPRLAALAAVRAVGRPGLALALVEDWTAYPGLGPGKHGLEALGALPPRPQAAGEHWRRFLDGLSGPDRELVAGTCALLPRFRAETWAHLFGAIPGATLELSSIATPLFGLFEVPPELRALAETSPQLHERLARLEHTESDADLRTAYHRYLGGDHAALAPLQRALLRITTLRRVPMAVLDTIESALDEQLLRGEDGVRMRIQTLRLARSESVQRWLKLRELAVERAAVSPRTRWRTEAAVMAWLGGWDYGESAEPIAAEHLALAGRLMGRLGDSPLRLTLGIGVGRALWLAGQVERAERFIRRQLQVAEHAQPNPDEVVVGRCALTWLTGVEEGLEDAPPGTSPWALAFQDAVRASRALSDRDTALAERLGRRATETPDHPPGTSVNLAAVLLQRRAIDEARELVSRGLVEVLASHHARVADTYMVVLLALTLDGPRPEWEDVYRLAHPVDGFHEVLTRWLDDQGPSERTAALRRLIRADEGPGL